MEPLTLGVGSFPANDPAGSIYAVAEWAKLLVHSLGML